MPRWATVRVYWNPFGASGDQTLQNSKKDYLAKSNTRAVADGVPTNLSGVRPYEILLIEGHGAEGQTQIAANENGSGARISAVDLAMYIDQSSLPKEHVLIKMTACYGEAFASELAYWLGLMRPDSNPVVGGYTRKVVYGMGKRVLIVPDPRKHDRFEEHFHKEEGNGEFIVWYDKNRNKVVKPVLKKFAFYGPQETQYDPAFPHAYELQGLYRQ